MISVDDVYHGRERIGSALGRDWREPGAFAWIALREPGPDELTRLSEAVGVPPDVVETLTHRPALAVLGDAMVIGVKTGRFDQDRADVDLIDVVLIFGPDFLATVTDGPVEQLESFQPDVQHGPVAAMHDVLDAVIDSYHVAIEGLNRAITEVELRVFADNRDNPVELVYRLRRSVTILEQAIAPLADEQLERLLRQRLPRWVDDDPGADTLEEIDRRLRRVVSRVGSLRDLLDSTLDANLTRVGLRQNEDMRKISAWVAIAAVPTGVAGIYGMNFEYMPELTWTFGYPLVLAVMVTICTVLYWRFKKNEWL